MALYYNGALLCIERASAGITIIEKVRDTYKYVNMMRYKSFDAKGKTVRKWGWETSLSSKPKMINSFVELFETGCLFDWRSLDIYFNLVLFFALVISKTYHSPNPRHNCISGIYLSLIIKYITTTYKC